MILERLIGELADIYNIIRLDAEAIVRVVGKLGVIVKDLEKLHKGKGVESDDE